MAKSMGARAQTPHEHIIFTIKSMMSLQESFAPFFYDLQALLWGWIQEESINQTQQSTSSNGQQLGNSASRTIPLWFVLPVERVLLL